MIDEQEDQVEQAGQQPAVNQGQRRLRYPVPTLIPFMQTSAEGGTDIWSWINQLTVYLDVVHLNQQDGQPIPDEAANILLNANLGQEAFRTFSGTDAYRDRGQLSHEEYKAAIIAHFGKKQSINKALHDFHKREQEDGELVRDFVAALKVLATDCQFRPEDLNHRIACQLVIGSMDQKAKKELFAREKELPLPEVIQFFQASETATNDLTAIKPKASTVGNTTRGRGSYVPSRFQRGRGTPQRGRGGGQSRGGGTNTNIKCYGCGSTQHRHKDPTCPALGKTCNNCGRENHFADQCRSSTSTTANRGSRGTARGRGRGQARATHFEQDGIAGKLVTGSQNLIWAQFYIKDSDGYYPMGFMVDTGANVSLLSQDTYDRYFTKFQLKPSTPCVTTIDGSPIPVLGCITTSVAFGGRIHKGSFFISTGPTGDVLGTNFLTPLKVNIDCSTLTVSAVGYAGTLKEFPRLTQTMLGTFKGQEHRILLREDAIPRVVRLRPIPLTRHEEAIKEIKTMDEMGIWEPVEHSEWVHPMVTVPKPDGGVRITTDLTALNTYVIPERFPLPRIKDIFLNLAGARYFSKLDLKKGYFHIPLAPESRHLTTTITPLGLRQYTRLPMGLTDAASAFQRRVHQTLAGLEGVEAYIDDIIIHGRTREEHDRRLRQVFARLANKDFRLQLKKLEIGVQKVKAFGHMISADAIEPDPANIQPILDAPPPTTAKEVQRFLGMINYFIDFLQDISSIAEPLRRLVREKESFKWTEECQTSFNTLKAMLTDNVRLHLFDAEADIYVTTDASDVGIGAILSQERPGHYTERPVAFFSRTLESSERNYAANEREALACLRAVEHWENFLLGRQFTLRTDHQTLQNLLANPKNKRQSAKFEHWAQRLTEFDYKVAYVPGPHNPVADYLSRLKTRARKLQVAAVEGIQMEKLQENSATDENIQIIRRALEADDWNSEELTEEIKKPYKSIKEELQWDDGVLWRSDRIIPPTNMQVDILKILHKGHPGIIRMKAAARTTYWWPGYNKAMEKMVQTCPGCQRSQKSKPPLGQETSTIPTPQKPGAQYAIDITGPFYNGRSLVVLIDYFSHYPEILDTTDTTSKRLIKWMQEIFNRNGNPEALVSDNGPQFVSQEFQRFLREKDIHHYTTSIYNPQENGLVEVFNKYIKFGVQAFHSTGKSWTEGIRDLIISYRFTPSGTGSSPADLFFGKECRPDGVLNITRPKRRQLSDTKPMKDQQPKPQQTAFRGYSVFQKGERVICKLPHVPKGHSPYSEPWTVERVLGTYTFLLSDGQVWLARKLKKWNAMEQLQLLAKAQWIDDDDDDMDLTVEFEDDLQPPDEEDQPRSPILRRSQRPSKGKPPDRFSPGGEVVKCTGSHLECTAQLQWID